MVSIDEFPISSANYLPGFKVVESKGFVYGLTVRSRGVGGNLTAGVRSLFGGEIKEYVKMLQDSREEALNLCIEHAQQLDANAIISLRYDSNSIFQYMQDVLAYGTAVIIEEE